MSNNFARDEEDPGTPTHRSRPSIITTASGIAESTMTYGSIMSSDGLARLSQFPPPPTGIPFTPIEAAFAGPSSPVTSDRSMTPHASPRRALPPIPPASPSYAKQAIPYDVEDVPSSHELVRSRPPLPNPPPSAALSGALTSPSPHDWHDGSSSITNDAYGEAVLSTSFITSLLSSPSTVADTPTVTAGPPSYKRSHYEPSVVSSAFTTDSTITYPPPKAYPPPLPTNYQYPPVSRPLPSGPQADILVYPSITHVLDPPANGFMATAGGRFTPDSLTSLDSSRIAQMVGPDPPRSMSVTPSFQSMTSATPLVNTLSRGDPILEEDEGKISGPSTPSQSRWSRTRERRSSTAQSTRTSRTSKSYVSSMMGRLSHSSGDRRSFKQATVALFRGKPLPPVPPLPDHAFREIRKAEDEIPLPDLVNRAATLSHLLDNGRRPHHSAISLLGAVNKEQSMPEGLGHGDVRYTGADPTWMHSARGRKGRSGDFTQQPWNQQQPQSPDMPTKARRPPLTKKRKTIIALIIVGLIIGITVGIAVGVTVGGKDHSQHSCPGNLTGNACTLDATCVCPTGGQCKQLAQGIADLINSTNSLFNVNFTSDFVSDALWQAQGSVAGGNCAAQVDLIDVAPALDNTSSPHRTLWAQAALLWNLVQSENVTVTRQLQSFVLAADWQSLGTSDGPSADSSSKFSTQALGFIFNFAAQTVQAPNMTFQSLGQPPADQIGKTNDVAQTALNRMYTAAYASSQQQAFALQHYWTGPLSQDLKDLSRFLTYIEGSPILLPFDATSAPGQHNISALLTSDSTIPFPPPLSCYPGLSQTQTQTLQELETSAFGLQPASTPSAFATSCYSDRPVYGVLDILALRLPFADGRKGVARQAALLTRDAYTRAVVYSGEVVSAVPGEGSPGTPATNPLQYGTMSSLGHVILQYLRSIQNIGTAIELVQYVLQPAALPPDNGAHQRLFSALATLPALEVAVFGTVDPSDIISTVSSLSDPNNNLFFGTDASHALRTWALHATQQGVDWAELGTSQQIVEDVSYTNADFNFVLNNATAFIQHPGSAIVSASNITSAFGSFQLLKPVPLHT